MPDRLQRPIQGAMDDLERIPPAQMARIYSRVTIAENPSEVIEPDMPRRTPTVWLLSAYHAASHAAWVDWLMADVDGIAWRTLHLPGRHFRWRIRGNPLSWLDQLPSGEPDLILATSMVDLATLKGLHPRLAPVPAYYYFHENQFAYPVSTAQTTSVDSQVVQLYGALCAQRLLFNSAFNRDSFLEGIEGFLRQLPDAVPRGVSERLAARSLICPVPIEPIAAAACKDERLILWNHRWEYDKAPQVFADAMLALADRQVDFRLALLGARAQAEPGPLSVLRRALPERILVDGEIDRDRYCQVIGRAGIVVSTALHEFQGLAVLEAASAGVRPLVPDALCYPEQYAAAYRYPPGDTDALVARLMRWLSEGLPAPVDVSPWYGTHAGEAWRELLRPERLISTGAR